MFPSRALLAAASLALAAHASADDAVRFDRDVRPILSDACLRCHGPDAARRKADLRLDTKDGLLASNGDARVVAPGDPDASELIRRVESDDPDERMPPPNSGKTLTADQKATLRRWVAQGAAWRGHWAFERPVAAGPPVPSRPDWVRNPIDAFVLDRLDREGLKPAPEADPTTLLRRATLDLTGLPPSPAEVDAFLADRAPGAYERAVDRLLASPRYGERMAVPWLEAARYADTSGYQSDGERFMWRWRDWVIDAYNANLPFDRFTVEQVAGDLLPDPTPDQVIATGFNRNHRGNAEGGIIPEEYAVEYVADRVDATATVWLGLTLGCARCHDHKFDPLSQRDFYRFFAFFNNVPERGRAIKYGNSPPVFPSPTRAQRADLADLDRRLARAEEADRLLGPAARAARLAWEAAADPAEGADWSPDRELAARLRLDDPAPGDGTAAAPTPVSGKLGGGLAFDGTTRLDAGDVGKFGFYDKFTVAAWVDLGPDGGGPIASRMGPGEHADGYALVVENGHVQVHLTKRWLDDALRVETVAPLPRDGWHHVTLTYDGSRVAEGVRIYVDGSPAPTRVLLDELNQTFESPAPFLVGAGGTDRFRGRIDEVRVHRDALDADEVSVLAVPEPVGTLVRIPAASRTAAQDRKLAAYFLDRRAPDEIRRARAERDALRRARARLVEGFPTTMVMREMDPPRPTHVLIRGEYDKPGDRVSAGVPESFPPLPTRAKADRLALARWLVDPAHPLTARVAVNRDWQRYFGAGLVRTVEDFGAQGTPPSHPELLDWLAVRFVESGWDVKALQRLIVTSATYRQASRLDADAQRRDPENRLLARGPRQRLSAEMIRDGALASAGLLVERVGGPSVKPYQPAGLWKELGDTDYRQGSGPDLYRRSLYTFWKRTVPPPMLATFDAPGREACSVRQVRTDTPLQALALLNDVTFIEAARGLAGRVLREGGVTDDARIARAFRLVAARAPDADEASVLREALAAHRARFRSDPAAARALLAVGESPADPALDPVEHAAFAALANTLLSLDETITKE